MSQSSSKPAADGAGAGSSIAQALGENPGIYLISCPDVVRVGERFDITLGVHLAGEAKSPVVATRNPYARKVDCPDGDDRLVPVDGPLLGGTLTDTITFTDLEFPLLGQSSDLTAAIGSSWLIEFEACAASGWAADSLAVKIYVL